jgi:hypothetical protein
LSVQDGGLDQAVEVARALIGGPCEVSRLVTRGRNSRIWRVQSGEREFVLKQYPSRQDDSRDRLSTEVDALRLMERYDITTVPRVLGCDRERGYALLSWIDGSEVSEISDADVDAAILFLGAIHGLRTTPWAAEQPLAAEACLFGCEIERQIRRRLDTLHEVAFDEHELIDFVDNSVAVRLGIEVRKAQRQGRAGGLAFDAELPQEWRSLVPSDFGFHNSLRRRDGSVAFLDFEYFGWDDPMKLTADILLHPGQPLQPPQRRRFRRAATQLYGADPAFAARVSTYLPLFGLRWVLILLNEFIPARWQRRILAGESSSWSDVKARQLTRAREFLAALREKLET